MPDPSMIGSSWADEIEEDESSNLPPPSEKVVGDNKIVTEYAIKEGKKVKIIRTFKIERKMVAEAVARRKKWEKFGMSRNDRPGPDPSTTLVTDEIQMQFITGSDDADKDDDKTALDKLKDMSKSVVKCRICKEDHWTTTCPYKDTYGPLQESLAKGAGEKDDEKGMMPRISLNLGDGSGAPGNAAATGLGQGGGKYVPPSRREGARTGDSMLDRRRTDDTAAIRVTNLPDNTQEEDLDDLFKPFGRIARIFLARDKVTGACKGFAFINYQRKEDAAKAVSTLNGFGYDHLILKVDWAKPSGS